MINYDGWRELEDSELRPILEKVESFLESALDSLRLGTYDEARHGTLQEVLEEIERILE